MSYSFEYIDIILLAMIAGFIFLRLRGILGRKNGFEGKILTQFEKEIKNINVTSKPINENFDEEAQKEFQKIKVSTKPSNENFDEETQKEFLKGAEIAYETIITDFSDSDNKLIASKPLLSKKIHDQFKEALLDREGKGHFAEITFIGIKSAVIKTHKKIISGDSEKIKTVYDTWVFSKDIKSANPNWLLIDTIT